MLERAFFLAYAHIQARGISLAMTNNIVGHGDLHNINIFNYNLIIKFNNINIIICQYIIKNSVGHGSKNVTFSVVACL